MSSISTLSNQHLLAILVGGDIAQGLAGIPLKDLFGIDKPRSPNMACESEARYIASPVVDAARELINRALFEELECGDILTSPEIVRNYLRMKLGALPYEVFSVLLLDAQNRLIRYDELFRGTLTQAPIYPREVVMHVLMHHAHAVIFAHNHPSGLAEPSTADMRITERLKQALALVDVRVLDHTIVAGSSTLSFAERGLL